MPREKLPEWKKNLRKHMRSFKKGDYTAIIFAVLLFLALSLLGFQNYFFVQKGKMFQAEINSLRETQISMLEQQVTIVDALRDELLLTKTEFEEAQGVLGTELAKTKIDLSSQISARDERVRKVIDEWRTRIVRVTCLDPRGEGYGESRGSGTLFSKNGQTFILTNYHIIEQDGVISQECSISFTQKEGEKMTFSERDFVLGSKKLDFAKFIIANPTPYMRNLLSQSRPMCDSLAVVGDDILIIGYPSIGDENDITVTEGIISGYDEKYYITSAKIEKGHSGSAGIHLEKSCYLGIPTFVRTGSIESLGRILDVREISF